MYVRPADPVAPTVNVTMLLSSGHSVAKSAQCVIDYGVNDSTGESMPSALISELEFTFLNVFHLSNLPLYMPSLTLTISLESVNFGPYIIGRNALTSTSLSNLITTPSSQRMIFPQASLTLIPSFV